jgi:hypothetical protein
MIIGIEKVKLRKGTSIMAYEKLYFQKLEERSFSIRDENESWPSDWKKRNGRVVLDKKGEDEEEEFSNIYW